MQIGSIPSFVVSTIPLLKSQIEKPGKLYTPDGQGALVPDELKSLFASGIGQRILSDYKRAELAILSRKSSPKSEADKKVWADFLFGEQNPENQEDEDKTQAEMEFFGNTLCQGNINDCFLIAVLYGAMRNSVIGKAGLADMIKPLKILNPVSQDSEKTYYQVGFPGFPDNSIIVDPQEMTQQEQVAGGVGYRILERAFAQLSQKINLSHSRSANHLDDTFACLNGGGYPAITLYAITGILPRVYGRSPDETEQEYKAGLSEITAWISREPQHYILIAGTGGNEGEYADPEMRFPCWHAYTLEHCPLSGRLIVVDPNDTQNLRHPATVDELTLYFQDFIIAEVV